MSATLHLFRRGAVYYWRRRVPAGVHDRLARRNIVVSLQTAAHDAARERATAFSAAFDRLVRALDHRPIAHDKVVSVLRQDVRAMLSAFENDRAVQASGLDGQLESDVSAQNEVMATAPQTSLMTNRSRQVEGSVTELSNNFADETEPDTQGSGASATPHRRTKVHNHECPRERKLGKSASGPELVIARANGSLAAGKKVVAEAGDGTVSDIGSIFLVYADEKSVAEWTAKTRVQSEQSSRLFRELTDVAEIAAVTRRTAAIFKEKLRRLPVRYAQCPPYAGKSADQVLELSADSPETRLSAKTVNRHIDALGTFWKWAKLHGYAIGENPFAGLLIAKSKMPKHAHQDRDMFDLDDLRRIFSSPIYTGCRSEQRRLMPGNSVIRDGRFWVPLIAAYSGARLEEICQLHATDIRDIDGVCCMVVEPGNGRRLKNANSHRAIPLHPILLGAGLVHHAETVRQAGHTNLFPGLPRGGPDMSIGFRFTKWFTTVRRGLGIAEGKSFHSFRHSFDTFLQRAGTDERRVGALLGHRPTTETSGRYFKGFPARQLFEAVCLLDYGPLIAQTART